MLQAGKEILYEQNIDIGPADPFWGEILLPEGVEEDELRISLLTSENRELITYSPVKKEGSLMPDPVKPPPLPKNIKTNEELYLAGLRLER